MESYIISNFLLSPAYVMAKYNRKTFKKKKKGERKIIRDFTVNPLTIRKNYSVYLH